MLFLSAAYDCIFKPDTKAESQTLIIVDVDK